MIARIEREEGDRLISLPSEEHIRAEVRARLLRTPGSAGMSSGSGAGQSSTRLSLDDDTDMFQLRSKIARLEGEQRIDATAKREGDLEVARLELREAKHRMR